MAKANVAWHRRADLWAPVVVVLTGLLFFADFLFSSKNFYFRDILNFHYPLRRLLLDSYARWEFPLWNPYLYLGQPMLANPNYLAFYPTNLFHLVCSFNYAFKLHFVIHPIAAGVGMYFLQRRLGLPPLASFGGSMTYQFSGIVLSFLNLYNILPAIALIPWIGWAFIRALDAPGLARALLLGLLLSFQAFAFEPMMFQCLIALLAGLAILHLLEASDRRRAWRSLLYTSAVGGLFGVALAAIQILPTLELLPRSARGAGFDFQELTTWSVHPIQLLNTVIPNFFGSYYTIGHVLSWGEPYTHGREGYIVSFFAGTGMVVLALLSVLSPRRRLCGVCSVLALGSVVCALGRFNPVYSWMLEHVPLLRLGRYPSKYMLLGVAALAVLTSIGLEVLLNLRTERRARRRPITVVGALAIALGIAFMSVWIFWQSHPGDLESLIRARTDPSLAGAKDFPAIIANLLFSIRSSGFFLLIAGMVVLVASLGRAVAAAPWILVVLCAAESIPANLRLSPLISDADMSFVSDVNRFITQNGPAEPFRVASPGMLRSLPTVLLRTPNRSAAWFTLFHRMSGQPMYGIAQGIQYSVDLTVDHLNTRESDILARECTVRPEEERLALMRRINTPLILSLDVLNYPALDQLAAFETRSDHQVHAYWLRDTISRAFFVTGAIAATNSADALRSFLRPDFDFSSTVILEGAGAEMLPRAGGAGKVRVVRYDTQSVACDVDAGSPGYLVLLDSHYPGWRAYVDGRKTEILRADFAFRAVRVDSGFHRVEFRYEPMRFYVGLATTCLALLFGIIVVVRSFRRRTATSRKAVQ